MATSSNKKLFDKYLDKMESLSKDKNADSIYRALMNGKNNYLRMSHIESSRFDPSWIKVIEDVLYDLGEIINNPRQVTKTESSVVPIELARKINGESVTHLASHTQLIKEIDEQGNVVPSKILAHFNEDNIHTYENRFIATFIRRLVLFVEKRYQFVQSTIPLYQHEVLIMKNTTEVNGDIVEIETKVRVRRESDDNVALMAKGYLERINKMREYITYYYNSPFMRKMKNERDVRKPILQTNIIRKNPKYHKCYETFLFIERFDALGVDYKVDEKYSLFTTAEKEQYNYLLMAQYLALQDTRPFQEVKTNNKVYKPKIQTSIDDEKFVYGPLYKGPIEFVRVDEGYRKYLEKHIRTDLPEHPNKYEKEYYADEYKERKRIREYLKELEKLLSRTYHDIAQFEKEVQKYIALREKEEREIEAKRLAEIRAEEDRRIELKRQEIIAAAKAREAERLAQEAEERRIAEEARKKAEKERLEREAEEARRREEEERLAREEEERRLKEEQERLAKEAEAERLRKEEEERLAKEEEERRLAEEAAQKALEEQQAESEPQEEEQVPAIEEQQPVAEEMAPEQAPAETEPEQEQTVEETSNEEPVVEETAPLEEVPQEQQAPEQEEVKEDEPIAEQPAEEVPQVEEPVEENSIVEEQPVEEQQESAPVEQEPQVEEQPQEEIPEEPKVEEKKAVEEPIVEQPKAEEPSKEEPEVKEQPEEAPLIELSREGEEKPKEPAKKKPSKKASKKEAKPEPIIEKKEEKRPDIVIDEKPEILDVIPGKFIVKAYEGYYINDKTFSVYKKDAKIFYDFNVAKQIKARFGGKVIKL